MQKTKSRLSALILCALLFSCGESTNQKKSATSDSVPLAAKMVPESNQCSPDSFFVAKADVDTMITNFQSVYLAKAPGLAKSIWIDTCVISAFAKLLQAGDYDGVRFYNVAKSRKGNGTGNPSYFIMAPTQKGKDVWGNIITVPEGCSTNPASFNIVKTEADNLIYNFGTAYRQEATYGDHSSSKFDSLSIGSWATKCFFEVMTEAMRITENKIDGFRIYEGAYKKLKQAPGQLYPNESNIIFVATKSDGAGGHTDNWEVFKDASQQGDPGSGGGLNHLTLCPNQCP